VFLARQVSDGARQFQNAVVSARGELHLAHGGFHQLLSIRIQRAVFAGIRVFHICIGEDDPLITTDRILKAFLLAGARCFHPRTDDRRGLPHTGVAQFLIFHARYLNVDIDAVEQRSGDTFLVLGDAGGGTGAGFAGIPIIPAGAGIHGGDQQKTRGIGGRRRRPRDRHEAAFEGLAERFQGILAEFRQFVQEEDPVVGEADLPRPRDMAAADQAGVGDGMMGRPEGALSDHNIPPAQETGDGIYLGRFDGLGEGQGRQDGRQAPGQHRLPAPRRAEH